MAKILVIDDEEIIRRRLKELLAMDGYDVFTADSGMSGLEIFKNENPGIVLVDIKMPGMDGIEVLHEVKKISPQTEVLVITGHGGTETAIEALRQNAFDYITKPLNYDELGIALKRALEKQSLLVENKLMQAEILKQRDDLKRRVSEISVLYEVSNAISYTLDYQTLFKLIMESLFKITDYDICGSLLFDSQTANIILKPSRPESVQFTDEVKNNLISSTTTITGNNIREKRLDLFVVPPGSEPNPEEKRKFDKIHSFFNVPFIIGDRTMGMINVSSCKKTAFGENDIKLIYTIANQAANAIERLQMVIKAEKSKMESMVASMIEGVVMVDERGEAVVLNPQARYMLGFSRDEEVTNLLWKKRMRETGLDKAIEECRRDKHLVVREIVSSHGESQFFCCDISPVTDAKENTIGIVVVVRDITKEKEVDRLKTEFISTVSHELRTPLTSMKNVVANTLHGVTGAINDKLKRYLLMMNEDIDRLSRLISNLLDISKIEARKTELKKTPVDINSLVDNAVSILKPEADKKHIELKTSFSVSAINVYADPDKMIQILVNLISNAIKFTTEAGKVLIEIKDKDKNVECSVVDTGIGIAPENIDKLFTKFQQFDRQDGEGAKGTGLGLAITKELVKSHNGTIRAESKLGQGSKFIFTIPKYTSEDIFKEYLKNGLRKIEAKNNVLSVLVLHINNFIALRDEYGAESVRKISSDLKTIVKKNVRRGFVSMHKESSIVIVLEETDRKGALAVQKKIADAIKEYKFTLAAGRSIGIPVTFGIATHPEEVITEKDMIPYTEEKQMEVKAVEKIILLVDDDKEFMMLTAERLKANGYKVLEACNGEEALKIMETRLPGLVIADVNMPVLDGFGLLEKMKKNKKLSSIPFIFLSGAKREFEDRVNGLMCGAVRYILKPYETAGFLSTIKSLLKANELNAEPREIRVPSSEFRRGRGKWLRKRF